ncbi:acetyl-CoA synthetase-like protein [Xylaria curta]|nr:acetyl-CoA synthetase-like protein [Xylaria curta]
MDSIPFGRRTVPSTIDEFAQKFPEQFWASFPIDGKDVQRVSFGACARAINAACWWLENTLGTSKTFQTIAYIGPNDIRYLIFFCVAVKCGYKILFTSPRNSHEGHAQLFKETCCTTLLCDSMLNLRSLAQIPSLKVIPAPTLQDLLVNEDIPHFPYEKQFDEVKDDPCIVLHTSGTTSLPKPVTLSHGQLAVFDAQWKISPLKDREIFLQAVGSCPAFLVALPFFHMAGFSMGIWLPLNPDINVIFTNPSIPLSLFSTEQALDSTEISGAIIPPSLLQEAVHCGPVLDKLARLRYIFYGGAPLSSEAGRMLSSRTHVCNQIGSTECVVFTTHLTDRSDWDYFCFGAEQSGYDFRPISLPGMFEMIVTRDDTKGAFQAIFQGNDLSEFSTKDLYSKHPTKPHHWKYQGRVDDVIILSQGEKLNPVPNESLISTHPLLKSVMYVGNGKPQLAAILELADGTSSCLDAEQVVEAVWPLIERANALSPSHGQLHKSHIIVADSPKKFIRTTKGSLKRLQTVQVFESEICDIYDAPVITPGPVTHVDISRPGELQEFVHGVYQNTTGFGNLQLDDDIFLVGADSLNIQTAIHTLKASVSSPDFRVDTSCICQKAVYANPTTRTMSRFLENLGRLQDSGTEQPLEQAGLLEEVYQRYRRRLPVRKDMPNTETPSLATVLLTGSTSNVGSYILHTLLKRDDVDEVICLNRSEDSAERQRKLNAEKGLLVTADNARVRFMHTDLSRRHFGLKQEDYDYMLCKVTAILHTQWPVNFNLPLSSFEPQLEGVVNLIKFTVEAAHKPTFFFVSSIATVNNWRRQVHLEHPSYDVPERHFTDLLLASSGYGQSKAIASNLLYCASLQCGLRGAILRLGQISGPVRRDAGAWNTREWLPSLVRTSHTLGVLPATIPLLNQVDWIPVDDAAQLIVELTLDTSTDKADPRRQGLALFNVANPNTVPWETLTPAVVRSLSIDRPLRVVPFPEWLQLLESSAPEQWEKTAVTLPALKLLDFFKELEEGRQRGANQTLLRTEITRRFSPRLARMSAIDKSMMANWLSQWGLGKGGSKGSPFG